MLAQASRQIAFSNVVVNDGNKALKAFDFAVGARRTYIPYMGGNIVPANESDRMFGTTQTKGLKNEKDCINW